MGLLRKNLAKVVQHVESNFNQVVFYHDPADLYDLKEVWDDIDKNNLDAVHEFIETWCMKFKLSKQRLSL